MKRIWPYSPQYNTIIGEGFHRPHPHFGTPTLVWHLGIWQNMMSDQVDYVELEEESGGEFSDYSRDLRREFITHDYQSRKFYREVSDFIEALQEQGCQSDVQVEKLNFKEPDFMPGDIHDRYFRDGDPRDKPFKFRVCDPQSIEFTIWWQDDKPGQTRNERQDEPQPSDLRVHVQLQTYTDHTTITFYIDVSKPWSAEANYDFESVTGNRRKKIFDYIHKIQQSANTQYDQGLVDLDLVPEKGIEEDEAEGLLAAANYLYEGVWNEFLNAFGLQEYSVIKEEDKTDIEGRRFADFRGLVMPVDQLRKDDKVGWILNTAEGEEQVSATHHEVFDGEKGEPNKVLRAHWPFFRRAVPWADYRDTVGCGLINFRALFMTSQKSASSFNEKEETGGRKYEVPAGKLSWLEKTSVSDTLPIRYLILTKGKPHREQIGRFVERINNISSMRLFALKSWPSIRNASYHVRLLGRQLDGVLSYWNSQSQRIDRRWNEVDLELKAKERGGTVLSSLLGRAKKVDSDSEGLIEIEDVRSKARLENDDRRIQRLNKLISKTERQIIYLSASLDKIGHGGSGRLLYVIRRSEDFIKEFYELTSTLQMKDIDTWINYEQFVTRGLKPTFSQIASTGERLIALRKRLEVITSTIQTSSLIIETEATRANTETLRKIARNFAVLKGAGVFGAGTVFAGFMVWVSEKFGGLLEAGSKLWEYLVSLWVFISSIF